MESSELSDYQLGETEGHFVCQGVEEHRAVMLHLMQQTEWQIDIFSRYFDPRIFGTEEFTDAIEQLALTNRRCQIRILLQEPRIIVSRGHLVIERGKQLNSFFHFRQTDEQHRQLPYSFCIVDKIAYVYQAHADALKSEVSFCDGPHAIHLTEKFEELWYAGETSPWLRNFII